MSDPTDPTLTSLHIYPDDTLRDGQRVHYGGSDRFDVSRAEYERMRAEFAGAEPVTERSCFTYRHDYQLSDEFHRCDNGGSASVVAYWHESGCRTSRDSMPTDRSIPCPGWSAKVPT